MVRPAYLFDTPLGRAIGDWNGEILPRDRLVDASRDATNIRHTQFFTPNLTLTVNCNHVSDSRYFVDLADFVSITSITTLPRDATLVWRNNDWLLTARRNASRRLRDPGALVLPPYDRPGATGYQPESPVYKPLADLPRAETEQRRHPLPVSQRGAAVRLPAYGYGTVAWRYDTGFLRHAQGRPACHPLPPDWHLRRPPRLHASASRQQHRRWPALRAQCLDLWQQFRANARTRAMFTYIPYRNQSETPVFDTALADFNQLQLFSETATSARIASATHASCR